MFLAILITPLLFLAAPDTEDAHAVAAQAHLIDRNSPGFDNGDLHLFDAVTLLLHFSDGLPGNSGLDFDTIFADVDETVWLAVAVAEGDGSVTLASDGIGEWVAAICNDNDEDGDDFEPGDDACNDVSGLGSQAAVIPDEDNILNVTDFQADNLGLAVAFECTESGLGEIEISQGGNTLRYFIFCHGEFASGELTSSVDTLEILPQLGHTDHALITLELFDEFGGTVAEGAEVDWYVNRCGIETEDVDSFEEVNAVLNDLVPLEITQGPDFEFYTDHSVAVVGEFDGDRNNLESYAMAIVHCDPVHVPAQTPGKLIVSAHVEIPGGEDQWLTVEIDVVGPPARLGIEANPSFVECGQPITLSATVLDVVEQPVSDHTPVEFTTNSGGTIWAANPLGAGASIDPVIAYLQGFLEFPRDPLNFEGPRPGVVAPQSSAVGRTFGGVANAIFLTSTDHLGPYNLVVTVQDVTGRPFTSILQVGCIPKEGVEVQLPQTTAPQAAAPPASTITPPNTGTAGLADD